MKYRLPRLTAAEWHVIEQQIPKAKSGPPPRHDREIVSALCYAEAARCSIEALPEGYPKAMSIRTRKQRWQRAGVLPKILDAAAPAADRIHADYLDRLHDLSPWGQSWLFGRKKDDPAFRNLPRR